MASTPPIDPRDEAFLREVDEAYREDELRKFIHAWGKWILLAVGLILALTGGWFFWQHQQLRHNEALSEQFSQALEQIDSGDRDTAMAALDELGTSGNASYRALARVSEADVAVSKGELKAAIANLQAVVDDKHVTGPLHDVAVIKKLRLEFDDLPPAEILKQTQPYLEGDSLWFPVAGELAALAHLKAGDSKAAGALFLRLAGTETAPASLRVRAEQLAASLGEDVTHLAEQRARAAAGDTAGDGTDGGAAGEQSAVAAGGGE